MPWGRCVIGVALKPLPWRERRWAPEDVQAFRHLRRQTAPYLASIEGFSVALRAEFGHAGIALRVVKAEQTQRLPTLPTFLPVPLSLAAGEARLVVYVPNALVMRLAMLSVGKHVFVRPGDQRPLPAGAANTVVGAIARAARRTGFSWGLAAAPPADGPFGLVHAQVQIDDDAFDAVVALPIAPTIALPPFSRAMLASLGDLLGDLPLALPVVASVVCAADNELAALQPGVAWVPGEEAWTLRPGEGGVWQGEGVLVAPRSELGLAVRAEAGGLRVTGVRADCPWDPTFYDAPDDEHEDGRLVVRLEAGHVALDARGWAAAFEPGALLPLPRGGATMRVVGCAVACGQIAPVGGELAFCVDATFASISFAGA